MAGNSGDAEWIDGNPHPMIPRRSFWRVDDGATAVEAGVVILVLVTLMVGTAEYGRALWTWNTRLLAIQEAGRYAMVYNPTSYPSGPPSASCPSAGTSFDVAPAGSAERAASSTLSREQERAMPGLSRIIVATLVAMFVRGKSDGLEQRPGSVTDVAAPGAAYRHAERSGRRRCQSVTC